MKKPKRSHRKRPAKVPAIDNGASSAKLNWKPEKRRITQADVERAGERSEVERQATLVARLRSRVTDLQGEQQHLEARLQQTRTDIATTMLQHVEATQKFKDMTALQQQVP